MTLKYARGPVSYLYRDIEKNGKTSRRKVKQVLWGDWVDVRDPLDATWTHVRYGKKPYLMKRAELQDERVLELIFLDIGQGDACIVTEPGHHHPPRVMVIDAGIGRNTNGFLNWRFRDFDNSGQIHAAIVTHPDADHYRGFQPIFENRRLRIEHVYHSGLVERAGDDLLGPEQGGYLTDIVETDAQMRALLSDPARRGRKLYPKLMQTALEADRIGPVTALTTAHAVQEDGRAWLPGFATADGGLVTIEVLGPVVEPDAAGQPRLRAFGDRPTSRTMDEGKTKNGHSVLLRLDFNGFRVLFGGDLNTSAECFLMQHYGDVPVSAPLAATETELEAIARPDAITAAAERFGVDLMKTCHHGSSDVTEEFLFAAHPAAYVVSSGDEEGHVHPRPDLLGLLGKTGAGARPLILSTELLRSTRERERDDLRPALDRLNARIEVELAKGTGADAAALAEMRAAKRKLLDEVFRRNVGVYGAINLRTDGRDAVIAFRKEKAPAHRRWFYYEMQRDPDSGGFLPVLGDGH